MKIGVISDTHNYFDPRIPSLFKGVEHILHAGDIGLPQIVRQLEQIAPVTAVSGNTDDPAFGYRETAMIELAHHKFMLHHIVAPHHLPENLQSLIDCQRPDAVVFGHTHTPFAAYLGRALYFNPGYAGKSRFGMERSLALLNSDLNGMHWEYLPL